MLVELRRSLRASPTHVDASQRVTPHVKVMTEPMAVESCDCTHGTSTRGVRRFLAVRLPPPLFMIRFR
jgi:hypothetical protein